MHAEEFCGPGLVAPCHSKRLLDRLLTKLCQIKARQGAGDHRLPGTTTGRQLRFGLQDIGLLDDVAKLTHVAGPFEGTEFGERLRRGLPHGQAIPRCELLREEFDELGNILDPLAERRHPQVDHVEPVVEIFAEGALLDLGLQIAVGCSHDLHVDRHRLRGAHGQHFSLLQHSEQFRLQFLRHLADLVEKHNAALCRPKDAKRPASGAGEGALFMAEQLAFGE